MAHETFSSPDASPGVPFSGEVRREVVVAACREAIRGHRKECVAAGRRLTARINGVLGQQREAASERAGIEGGLLRAAHEYVLDSLQGPPQGGVVDDAGGGMLVGRPGFEPRVEDIAGGVPAWMRRCFAINGVFEAGHAEAFWKYATHLTHAAAGREGDLTLFRPIDLQKTSAIESYVRFMAAPRFAAGEEVPVRRGVDPMVFRMDVDRKAAALYAGNPAAAIGTILGEVLAGSWDRPLAAAESWDLVLLALLVLDEEFDPRAWRFKWDLPWEDAEVDAAFTRASLLLELGEEAAQIGEAKVCELATRAVQRLEGASVEGESDEDNGEADEESPA